MTVDDEKEKEKPPLERKKSKPQPVGTIPYEVRVDTLWLHLSILIDYLIFNLSAVYIVGHDS